MKKAIILLLAAAISMGLAAHAFAENYTDGNWEYSTNGSEATIIRYLGNDRYLGIPSSLGGLTVTAIGESVLFPASDSEEAHSLLAVTVPGTVKVMEGMNFVSYPDLVSVELSEGLQSIGDDCFSYCGSLQSIRIPSTVTGMGYGLFEFSDQLVVEVYAGSVAETYCRMEGIPYRVIGGEQANAAPPQPAQGNTRLAVDPKTYRMHTFDEFPFRRNQTLKIYSGPGTQYYRSANGKALASTNRSIYIFGWEGDWLMVLYGTGDGKSRYGYTHKSDFTDKVGSRYMEFAHLDATIATECTITDCMPDDKSSITTLHAGTPVDYLAYNPDFDWAYIEVSADAGLVRGFVPYNCLGF